MDLTAAWHSAFSSWPAALPKAGLIVTTSLEPVPFIDFLLGDSFIVIERDKPDSQGSRKLIIALAAITAVKLSTTEELKTLAGFTEAKKAEDDGFGMSSGLAARAAAAVRRTSDPPRRPF